MCYLSSTVHPVQDKGTGASKQGSVGHPAVITVACLVHTIVTFLVGCILWEENIRVLERNDGGYLNYSDGEVYYQQ